MPPVSTLVAIELHNVTGTSMRSEWADASSLVRGNKIRCGVHRLVLLANECEGEELRRHLDVVDLFQPFIPDEDASRKRWSRPAAW
jgi:hypothetical protein